MRWCAIFNNLACETCGAYCTAPRFLHYKIIKKPLTFYLHDSNLRRSALLAFFVRYALQTTVLVRAVKESN